MSPAVEARNVCSQLMPSIVAIPIIIRVVVSGYHAALKSTSTPERIAVYRLVAPGQPSGRRGWRLSSSRVGS